MADESTLSGSLIPTPSNCIKPITDAGYPAGTPVAASATNGEVSAALADTLAHANKFLGLLVQSSQGAGDRALMQYIGPVKLTTAEWDAVAGTSGGLTAGTPYYLSATAGKLTATPPAATGNADIIVGVAISATLLMLAPHPAPVAHA